MAFSRKVHNTLVTLHRSQHRISVTDIALYKIATLAINEVIDTFHVAGVRELVKDRHGVIAIGK